MAKSIKKKIQPRKGSYLLKVRLVEPNLLDVDDEQEQNRIERDKDPQLITWELEGAPAGFRFAEISGAESGFTWIPGPKPTTPFKELKLLPGKRKASVKVTHRTDFSNGSWTYMLRVTNADGTRVYSTTRSDGRIVTINNPVIINR